MYVRLESEALCLLLRKVASATALLYVGQMARGRDELERHRLWATFSGLFTLITFVIVLITWAASPTDQQTKEPAQIPGHPKMKNIVSDSASDWSLALVISICAFGISATGTVSAIILGWRNERRQAAEFHLKIEALELQLAEARRKQNLDT